MLLADVIRSVLKEIKNFKNLVVVAPLRRGVSLASKYSGPATVRHLNIALTQQNVNYYKNGK